MNEYELIQGESSENWDIGLLDENNLNIAMDSNYTCTLQVKPNLKSDYVLNLNNFSLDQNQHYFKTNLKPNETQTLKPSSYLIIWKIENQIEEFAKEIQAKLKVKESGIK